MNTKSINVLGYTGTSSQFVVKTVSANLKISDAGQTSNPYEYILAGFAGCINALAKLIAAEHNIVLDSLQLEIKGELNTDHLNGFSRVEIVLKPTTNTPLSQLMQWLKEIQARSPVYGPPINLVLFKEYAPA